MVTELDEAYGTIKKLQASNKSLSSALTEAQERVKLLEEWLDDARIASDSATRANAVLTAVASASALLDAALESGTQCQQGAARMQLRGALKRIGM